MTSLAVTAANNPNYQVSANGWNALALPVADRATLAQINNAGPRHLIESGREGLFYWDGSNLSAEVTSDPNQIVYVAPTGGSGATGAWVRQDNELNPLMAGVVNDGITDDSDAFQAFNDFAFATIRPQVIDLTCNIATTKKITIGPSTATDQTGLRYNIRGNIQIQATAALDVVCEVKNLNSCAVYGRLKVTGTGGAAWTTRTCGICVLFTNCSNAVFTGGVDVSEAYYIGTLFTSDGSHFNDGLKISFLRATFCGSGITTSGLAQTANWTAFSSTQTGTLTNGSAVVTALSSTTGMKPGQGISGTGIPAATTILTVDSSTQVTMNANATVSASNSLVIGSNSSTSGTFNQRTVIGVDALPPALIDTYSTWGSNAVAAVINGEPYAIESVDRTNGTITIYRWLDSAVLATASGTLNYIYGGGYTATGADSGIIKIDHLQLVDCGIGLDDRALYGSRISSAIIESCGIAMAFGGGKVSAHIGSSFDAIYVEGNTFDVIWFGAVGNSDYSYVTSTYNVDIAKCRCLADPRLTNDLYGGFGGAFGSPPTGDADTSALTLAINGRLHAYHGKSQHNPTIGGDTVDFYGHTRAPEPKFYDANSLTIRLNNVANGSWNRCFGFRHNIVWINGTGTNGAPTGTITINPPTTTRTGCGTTNGSTTVTVPLLGMGTKDMFVGMLVSGTGIPAGSTVASITDRTHFELSSGHAATATGTVTLTLTGSVNGSTSAITYTGFTSIFGILLAHKDPWEMQFEAVPVAGWRLSGSKTYNPPSIAAAGTTTTTVTVTGLALGDGVVPSFSLDLQGIAMTGYASAADTATVVLFNPTAGALDLASGTLTVRKVG